MSVISSTRRSAAGAAVSDGLPKRMLDVTTAALMLLGLAPLLALIALAIRFDSPGPVIFTQIRIGRNGRRFRVRKFRTMIIDAEARQESLTEHSKDPDWLLLERDPRVTRIGRLLRCTSLDELPQLWNVLRGEMSLVGPRPLTERDDERVPKWAHVRSTVTPGVTGLWQVSGRTEVTFQDMVRLDCEYAQTRSFWVDLKLMLRTIPAVLSRRGAN